jgi:hypothetical protein
MELLHLASLRRKVVEQKPQVFGDDDERELPPATLTANAQHRMQWVSGMLTNLLGKLSILGAECTSWVDEIFEPTCLVVLKYLPHIPTYHEALITVMLFHSPSTLAFLPTF